jgi:hypothetical protein
MRRLALLLAVVLAAVLAVVAIRPPGPVPARAPADRFSAARALVDVRAISAAPHVTGSAESARVRGYLVARLAALGLTVETQAASMTPRGAERLRRMDEPPAREAVNIVARLPGRDAAQPAVALMAHYDTVPGSPGAADDGAGVAAALEVARALKAGPQPARDLLIVLTDAEELNSDGATAFFAGHPEARRIGAVVNLEARGGGGRALMFETGPGNGAMASLYARAVAHPSANSLAVWIYRLMPNYSDFSIPKAAGTPGFNIAFLGAPALYHAPQAMPERVDPGSVQHLGGQALDIVRALVTADRLPPKAPDAVFFDILGQGLVVHPPWAGWIVLVLAGALVGFAYHRTRRAGLAVDGQVAFGAAWGFGLLLMTALALNVGNTISGQGRGANYFDRLAAIPRLELQAALLGVAVPLFMIFARPAASLWSRWLGLALTVLAAAAAVQLAAPYAAPILAWPLLLAAVGLALAAGVDPALRSRPVLAALALLAGLAVAQTVSLAHLAFLGVGADAPSTMSLFVMIVVLLLLPLVVDVAGRRPMLVLAAVLTVAAVGIALWVRFDPMAPTVPAFSLKAAN